MHHLLQDSELGSQHLRKTDQSDIMHGVRFPQESIGKCAFCEEKQVFFFGRKQAAPFRQNVQNIVFHWLILPFAFAEDSFALAVLGEDIDFRLRFFSRIVPPPAAGLFEDDGKPAILIFPPEPFECDALEYLSHEIWKFSFHTAADELAHAVLYH